jgi:hypothetical protein
MQAIDYRLHPKVASGYGPIVLKAIRGLRKVQTKTNQTKKLSSSAQKRKSNTKNQK